MPLNDKQWKVIEALLSFPLGKVKLQCDGYEVVATVRPLKDSMKLVVAVFVGGRIEGKWGQDEDPRCTKFWQKKTKYLLPPAQRKKAMLASRSRNLSKADRDFFKQNAERTYEFWQPYWEKPSAFLRNIRKTCAEIEFIGGAE